MKNLTLITLCMLLAPATYAQTGASAKFKKLHWLAGRWESTSNKPGQSGSETWTAASAGKMSGFAVTLKGKDTVFVERSTLEIKGDDIFYNAQVTGSAKPVPFKLTSISDDNFVCENLQHDFPKKISYKLTGNRIYATISGNGKTIPYNFIKAAPASH
ncbi:MAG: DUF6265 family protein [Bacteroidota bacterium]